MIDESKLIFFTGAPGSKWSAVSNLLSLTPKIKINTTDRSEARTYTHPAKFNSAQHLGSYFGPGMEFGHKWHEMHKLSKDEILSEIEKPWAEERPDEYRIVKCHVMCNNLDFIKKTFPNSKIMIVFRPVESCYKGWFGSGGFDIPYPKYEEHYIDEPTAKKLIEEETRDARQWIFNQNLPVHNATARHWEDFWNIKNKDPESKEYRHIRSIEGYVFANTDPSRYVTLDTCLAYYNFEDVDVRL